MLVNYLNILEDIQQQTANLMELANNGLPVALEDLKRLHFTLIKESANHTLAQAADVKPHPVYHKHPQLGIIKRTAYSRREGYMEAYGEQRGKGITHCKNDLLNLVQKIESNNPSPDDAFVDWLATKMHDRSGMFTQYMPQTERVAQEFMSKLPALYRDPFITRRANEIHAQFPNVPIPAMQISPEPQ